MKLIDGVHFGEHFLTVRPPRSHSGTALSGAGRGHEASPGVSSRTQSEALKGGRCSRPGTRSGLLEEQGNAVGDPLSGVGPPGRIGDASGVNGVAHVGALNEHFRHLGQVEAA